MTRVLVCGGRDFSDRDRFDWTMVQCDGTGHIRAFSHIANGTCFACGGTGTARTSRLPQGFQHKHPVIAEGDRATPKQWAYIEALCDGRSDVICRHVHSAGAPCASEPYVSRAVMSAAIEAAQSAAS